MSISRSEILKRLRGQIDGGKSILVVGAGNGLVARCAEEAGADLVVVYNSGHFRMNGLPSFVGNLPVGDANALMLEMGDRNILPVMHSTPVIGGAYAIDPTRRIANVLDAMQRTGYSGVINFPSVGRLDGQFRQELESAGYGFQREVEMIRLARDREMFSLAYVFNPDEAERMAEAGADVVVGHVGRTGGGDVGSPFLSTLDEAAEKLEAMFAAAQRVRRDIIVLSHGGPVVTAEDAETINLQTSAVGFVAASSFERIPVEAALKQACHAFKMIRVGDRRDQTPANLNESIPAAGQR